MKLFLHKLPYILLLSLIYIRCSSISTFDQTTIDQAASLKTLSLYLMGKASDPYSDFSPQADDLKQKLNAAYQYSKSRINNDETTKQWEALMKPDGNLLGGFLTKWQAQKTLSETFINHTKDLVRNGFDEIIDLERSKK